METSTKKKRTSPSPLFLLIAAAFLFFIHPSSATTTTIPLHTNTFLPPPPPGTHTQKQIQIQPFHHRYCASFPSKYPPSICNSQFREFLLHPPPTSPPSLSEIDPRYGVEKRLVPSGPNPLHN